MLFGAGGGAGYIFAQPAVNFAVPRRHGLVSGNVAGLYPVGAVIAAPLFGWGIRQAGVRATLRADWNPTGEPLLLDLERVPESLAHSGTTISASDTTHLDARDAPAAQLHLSAMGLELHDHSNPRAQPLIRSVIL